MRYLLLDAGNTYNYGSMMMVENFIHYLQTFGGENQFYISTNDEIHVKRLIEATGYERIFVVNIQMLIKEKSMSMAYLKKKILHKRITTDFFDKMDKIIFFGGDDFTPIYGKKQLLSFLCYADAIKYEDNYVGLIGQSVGPFSGMFEFFALSILRKMDLISLRDPESMGYMVGKKFKNIENVTDLALLPLAREQKYIQLDIAERNTVILCPSEIMYRHAGEVSREGFVNLNANLCRYILDSNEDDKIILLPHVWDDTTHGDNYMCNDIFNKLENKYQERIDYINRSVLPWEVREVIKKSKYIIAERMHPAVSGLECGVPALTFSYGRKYEGIFENLYGLKKCVLDIREFSDYDEMTKRAIKIIKYIEKNKVILEKKIKDKNQETQPIILEHIKKFR